MYLDHKITLKIARILEMADANALLIGSDGSVILPERDTRVLKLPEAIRQNPAQPMVYGGVTLIGTNEEQPVYICLPGDDASVKKCAMLCAELINQMVRSEISNANCEQSLRAMLRGEIDVTDFEALAVEHHIPLALQRCVLYFHFPEMEAQAAIPLLMDARADENDLVTEVSRHAVAMLKTIDSEDSAEEMYQFAVAVENSFLAENGEQVCIGISNPFETLQGVTKAYREARSAINVGICYHANRTIFEYRRLLLERFLDELPVGMSRDYNAKIFNKKTARLFNEEMLHTIEVFFENSLNLSETARKLYIHRNTLVYRLDKVQRQTGLDLRDFDEAVTFKMMMLLGKNTEERKMKM